MTSTQFPPRTLVDDNGDIHCLELTCEGVFLDDAPALIEHVGQETIRFKTTTCDTTVALPVLGAAFAGTDPSLMALGTLFGAYLHLLSRQMVLAQSLHRLQEEAHLVSRVLSSTPPLVETTYRFDPLTERTLRLFDGTEEMTRLIAGVLDQPPAIVKAWATCLLQWSEVPLPSVYQNLSLGLQNDSSDDVRTLSGQQESKSLAAEREPESVSLEPDNSLPSEEISPSSEPSHLQESPNLVEPEFFPDTSAQREGHVAASTRAVVREKTAETKWTSDRLEQLKIEILARPTLTLAKAIIAVAPLFSCNPSAIHSQVYLHKINEDFKKKKKKQDSPRTLQETSELQDASHCVRETPLENTEEDKQDANEEQVPEKLSQEFVAESEGDVSSASPLMITEPLQSLVPDTFSWDEGKIQQLTVAFMQSQAATTPEIIQEIAIRLRWPLEKVRSKVHYLQLPAKKERQQQKAHPFALLQELPLENELKQGPHAWTIRINGEPMKQWYLSYPARELPQHFLNREIVYQRERYHVIAIYNQELRLSRMVELAPHSPALPSPRETIPLAL